MALTQAQVNAWFDANPDATAEDVAKAVESIGGLGANEGLAALISNRLSIAEPEITNYYNAYTAPTTNTYFQANKDVADSYKQNTYGMTPQEFADFHYTNYGANEGRTSPTTNIPAKNTATFTDTITAGQPTTQAELLSALADTTTNTTGTTTDTSAVTAPTSYTKSFGGQNYTLANSEVDFLTNQILAQNLTSQWKGEGFGSPQANARAMAENMLASGIKNINQVGKVNTYQDAIVIGQTYNGQPVRTINNEDGTTTTGYYTGTGQVDNDGEEYQKFVEVPKDAKLITQYGQDDGMGNALSVDPSKVTFKDGKALVATGTAIGNKDTGNAIINDYGERGVGNAFSGTYAGSGNTAYRVQFDAKGNPYFYTTGATSSDIADWGPILSLASVIPSPIQPFAMAANAAIAIHNNDILGGIASLAGVAGFSEVAAGARIASAAKSGDPFAIVTSIMNSPFAGDVGNTMLTDTISLRDAGNAVNVINNVKNENWAGALSAVSQLTGSSDVKTAAAATQFILAAKNNNFAGMYTAANGFTTAMNASNKITDKNVALNLANSVADANSDAVQGTQLASLASNTVSDAGNGFTLQGDGNSTLNFPDLTGSSTINADASLFNSSIGDLDTADTTTGNITDTTGLDTGDVITSLDGTGGNITDTTGLDEGTIIPDGTGDDELNLTTVCGPGMSFNTATGECEVNKDTVVVKGKKESCPVGTKLNMETGECDPDWDETGVDCAPGFHDDGTGFCVADDDLKVLNCAEGYEPNEAGTECIQSTTIVGKKESCPVGTKLNPETGNCDPDWDEGGGDVCGVGEHQDPATGMCVPDEEEPVKCEAGFHKDASGVCVPDEETPCAAGFHRDTATGLCVLDEDKPCADGFHKDETGLCVPDEEEPCDDGYHRENGVCVPDDCKEGYIRNLETGLCEKVEDKACPPGQVKNADGKCVPITKITSTNCQPGYEKVNGVCVPMCQTGYVRINGVCKKITADTVMPTSSVGGQGDKTDPIYAGGMDDFNLLATLEQLLADEPKKKDDKKSKDKTKMATGGHLDDLLAEQMTVDDLLKLLR
jgi:hypothetical protein